MTLFGLDKFLSPNIWLFFKITFKWLFRLLTIFNIVLALWIFYFNTPIITTKLLLGWIADFFRVAWYTYTDTIAKFFDYIAKIGESGLKNVPTRNTNPVESPDYGFIKQYRELFSKIRELPPLL